LDIDVLTLRSFDPLLNLSDVVMTHQEDDQDTACNVVIIGKKMRCFLKRLYDAYQSFDQTCWDCYSVKIRESFPLIDPTRMMILPTNTFFRPS